MSETKPKKDKKKKKKSGFKSFLANFWLISSFFKMASKLGLPIPSFLLDQAEDLLESTTGMDLGDLKDKAEDLVGSDVMDTAGDVYDTAKDSGIKAKDLKKAAKTGVKVAETGSFAYDMAGGGNASDISSGTDTVEGITIEAWGKIGAEMARSGQDHKAMEAVISRHGMNWDKYQKVAQEFATLMQKDTSLAQRYSQAYQAG